MSKVRIGLVGAGVIAGAHLRGMKLNEQACELVAVCDTNIESARKRVEEFGVGKAYSSQADMLANEDMDAVAIVTPHPSHAELALEAIAAGKHVLLEKPITVSVSEGDRIVEAANKAGVLTGVTYQFRTFPTYSRARQLIREGAIGQVISYQTTCASIRLMSYYDTADWRGTWAGEGGGVLLNQAPHQLDMMVYLFESPGSVYAVNRNVMHEKIEVEDTSTIVVEHANGVQGVVTASTTIQPWRGQYCEFYVFGTQGNLYVCNDRIELQQTAVDIGDAIAGSKDLPAPMVTHIDTEMPAGLEGSHQALYANFCEALQSGTPLVCSGADALRAQELINGATLSSYTGSAVTMPLDRARFDALLEQLRGLGPAARHAPGQPSPL